MNCIFIQLQILIYKLCRYRNLWFCDQYRTFYHRWKCGKLLTNSFCKCGSTHNAVRNICTDLNPTLHQFFFGQSKFKHTVHTIKHRCSICTSTGHSRCDRNILVQLHIDTVPDLKFIHQKFCCLVDKIILICRQKRQICRHCNPACCLFHFKTVKQVDGLHDHFHFMVPILTSAHNIKPKIYFCKCFY